MFKIIKKEVLSSVIKSFEIEAPDIAKHIKPGQFIVLRLHEKGERFPLTVAGKNLEKGTIKIIFQEAGKSTTELGTLKEVGEGVYETLEGNEVRIYSCGPTVYSFAHIGNFRAYVFMDTLR